MSKKYQIQNLNFCLFEIRYSPNPKVLDNRGKWVSDILPIMEMTDWMITENRLDIRDKDERRKAFCGYKNSSFFMRQVENPNEFYEESKKFLEYFLNQPDFVENLHVERIGVRCKFARTYKGNFDFLLKQYSEKFILVHKNVEDILQAKILDIGSPLTLQTPIGTINLMTGPMKEEQLKQYFKFEGNIPVSIYTDFDYWINPKDVIGINELLITIRDFNNENWARNKTIVDLLCR